MERYISGEKHKEMVSSTPLKRYHNRLPILIVAILALLFVGFMAGMSYQKSRQTSVANAKFGYPNSSNGSNASGRFIGRRGTIGQVTAVSDSSITVQDSRSGNSVTLSISSSTQISNNGTTVAANSIKVGDTVLMRANPSDPSQAIKITVNPTFGGGPPTVSPGSSTTDGSPNSVMTN